MRTDAPAAICLARRTLEELDSVQILQDWEWHEKLKRWYLCCRLTLDETLEHEHIPKSSEWFVLVEPIYPWGSIDFFPSKSNSIEVTFQHQNYNSRIDEKLPWMGGNICLGIGVGSLNRYTKIIGEPFDAERRLIWYFERAFLWLQAAAKDELVLHGESFELPDFPTSSASIVGFSEHRRNFKKWMSYSGQFGLITYSRIRLKSEHFVITGFTKKNKTLVSESAWGRAIQDLDERQSLVGGWVLLKQMPVFKPWQAPCTWGELFELCLTQNIDLLSIIEGLAPNFRDGTFHLFLVGFPIPKEAGEKACQIFWQALRLPLLAYKKGAKGFSKNPWQKDILISFAAKSPVDWIRSRNWGEEHNFSRGGFSPLVNSARMVFIGAGALGSTICEIMTRAGVRSFTIIDGDKLEMGNLVRHTLGISEIGCSKAEALCRRLIQNSPHVTAIPLSEELCITNDKCIQAIDQGAVIIDTTGADDVLAILAQQKLYEPKLFISCSVGFKARTLYVFAAVATSFPHEVFIKLLQPWLLTDAQESDEIEFPREGYGCWHPLFPARIDDIYLMASTVAKEIEELISYPPSKPTIIIYKQKYNEDKYIGLELATKEEYDG